MKNRDAANMGRRLMWNINEKIKNIIQKGQNEEIEQSMNAIKKYEKNDQNRLWKMRKNILGKKEQYPIAIENERGIKQIDNESILYEYTNYFKNLLTEWPIEQGYEEYHQIVTEIVECTYKNDRNKEYQSDKDFEHSEVERAKKP